MSVVNKRWDGQTITPKHDSIQYDLGQNGIMHGCAITHLGTNILRIAEGYIVICGRLIEVDQTDINCEVSSSGMLEGQLIIRLNLGATESVEVLSEAAASLTELTQDDDANYDNGIYEIQLARYNVNETTISNLEVTAPIIEKLGEKVEELSDQISTIPQFLNLSNKKAVYIEKSYDNVGITNAWGTIYANASFSYPSAQEFGLTSVDSIFHTVKYTSTAVWVGSAENGQLRFFRGTSATIPKITMGFWAIGE